MLGSIQNDQTQWACNRLRALRLLPLTLFAVASAPIYEGSSLRPPATDLSDGSLRSVSFILDALFDLIGSNLGPTNIYPLGSYQRSRLGSTRALLFLPLLGSARIAISPQLPVPLHAP